MSEDQEQEKGSRVARRCSGRVRTAVSRHVNSQHADVLDAISGRVCGKASHVRASPGPCVLHDALVIEAGRGGESFGGPRIRASVHGAGFVQECEEGVDHL